MIKGQRQNQEKRHLFSHSVAHYQHNFIYPSQGFESFGVV